MGAQLRIYRRRMRSVKATKKITKAMELISASRIVKAQQRVAASTPYANELTRAVSAVATYSSTNHPLTTASERPIRAAILIISADRGMAGAYSNNAIKEGEQLAALLREPAQQPPLPVLIPVGVGFMHGAIASYARTHFGRYPKTASGQDSPGCKVRLARAILILGTGRSGNERRAVTARRYEHT